MRDVRLADTNKDYDPHSVFVMPPDTRPASEQSNPVPTRMTHDLLVIAGREGEYIGNHDAVSGLLVHLVKGNELVIKGKPDNAVVLFEPGAREN